MRYLKVILIILLVFSCSRNTEDRYDEVLELILDQYPMYVSVSPDGKQILLKSRMADTFEILVLDMSSSRLHKIDSSFFTQLSLTWHPNGNEIIFQEFNPIRRAFDLYKIDLNSKKRSLIGLPPSNNAIPPLRWSNNGNYLAYLSSNGEGTLNIYDYPKKKIIRSFQNMDVNSDFQWYDDENLFFIENPEQPIFKKANVLSGALSEYDLISSGEVSGDFSLTKDNVLFIARMQSDEYFQCYEMSLKNLKVNRLTSGKNNISTCKYSLDGFTYYYNRNENGISKLYCSDSIINRYLVDLTEKKGSLEINLDLEKDLYVTNLSCTLPPQLLRINTKQLKYEIKYNPGNAENLRLKKPHFVEIDLENSNSKVPAYFWFADSLEVSKKTIVYVHGGPHYQSKPFWNARTQIFNNFGFNVLTINYRGSTGYSYQYSKVEDEEKQTRDILASIEFLQKEYAINPENVILVGFSYGGKLVLKASSYLEQIGGLVLISGVVDFDLENLNKLKNRKLFGFYGDMDPLSRNAFIFFEKKDLFKPNKNNFTILKGEGHILHKSDSWALIYSSIIEAF